MVISAFIYANIFHRLDHHFHSWHSASLKRKFDFPCFPYLVMLLYRCFDLNSIEQFSTKKYYLSQMWWGDVFFDTHFWCHLVGGEFDISNSAQLHLSLYCGFLSAGTDFLGSIVTLRVPLHALAFRIHIFLEHRHLLGDCSFPGICHRDPRMT